MSNFGERFRGKGGIFITRKYLLPILTLCSLMTAMFIFPVVVRAQTADGNLLVNGSFEDGWEIGGETGWQWQWESKDIDKKQGHSLNENSDNVKDGGKSWYVDGTAIEWTGFYQDVAVKPKGYYKLDFSTKLLEGRVQAYICLITPDGGEGNRLMEVYGSQDGVRAEHGQWLEDGVPLVRAGDETAKLRVVVKTAIAEQGPETTKGYIDNIRFYECDALGLPVKNEETESKAEETASLTSQSSQSSGAGENDGNNGGINPLLIGGILAAVVLAGAAGMFILSKKKKE